MKLAFLTSFLTCAITNITISNISPCNSGGMLFEPYSFPQKGWFSDCDFTCDGNIYDFGGDPFKHAELHAVNNVRFVGCNFSVSNVPAGQLSKTTGILASGSMFRVTSGSTFRGFDIGIHAAGQFSLFNAFTVNNCTFSNNQTGIYATGMQNFTVTQNTFEVGGTDFQSNNPCGLMMYECTGYTVEENTFYGTDDVATGRFGTMTENSGDDVNFIQGNIFHHLEYANYAEGDNQGSLQGLQYLCNGNGDNLNDFYVAHVGDGIHTKQGNGTATMNTFSHLGGDFTNNVGFIDYYHKDDPAHEPQNPFGITKIQVTPENTCPSDEPPCDFPCKFTATEWQQHESDFHTARDNWHTEKASLLSLMDGGHYRVVPSLGGGSGPQGLVAPPPSNGIVETVQHLTAFPNPARNSVTFLWDLPEGAESAAILLSDLQGKTIEVL